MNFPTTNAKDPNPSTLWCQLTDEDACAGRIGVKRPTAPSDMTQLSSSGVKKPTLSLDEHTSKGGFNAMFHPQSLDLQHIFPDKVVPWHQSIVLQVSSSCPFSGPSLALIILSETVRYPIWGMFRVNTPAPQVFLQRHITSDAQAVSYRKHSLKPSKSTDGSPTLAVSSEIKPMGVAEYTV